MRRTPHKRTRILVLALGAAGLVAGGFTLAPTTSPAATDSTPGQPSPALHDTHHHPATSSKISTRDRIRAQRAAAAFQDVETAKTAGWESSLQTLGCFQDPARGGMGVHYINDALLDDTVDITQPEALVYELGADASVTGLVAHEYIVPIDAWSRKTPPRLFGVAFHQHPTLPLFVLHAWLWKGNARGDFDDWNPAVRQCPPGVPIFGKDLPTAPR